MGANPNPLRPQPPAGFVPEGSTPGAPSAPQGFVPEEGAENPIPNNPHWLAPELGHIGIGIAKGAGQTVNTVSKVLGSTPGVGKYIAPQSGIKAAEELETPHGISEGIGIGIENALEFVAGDEALKGLSVADKLGLAERIWAKVGETALRQAGVQGGLTVLHGGSAKEAALATGVGAVTGGAAELAASKVAPKMIESGLGINWTQRAHGANPGEAALAGTRGLTPGAVEKSARQEIQVLTSKLEHDVATSPNTVNMQPAIDALDDAKKQALRQNNSSLVGQIETLKTMLTHDLATNTALPADLPASRALDLKRGMNEQVGTWIPTKGGTLDKTARRVYKIIDQEIDRAVPGTEEINNQIHSLIPIRDRATIEQLKAGIIQQAVAKLSRPTGALAGAGFGAMEGKERGGTTGEVVGGLLGLAGGSIIASPTTMITLARLTGKSQQAVGAAVRAAMANYQMATRGDEEDKTSTESPQP